MPCSRCGGLMVSDHLHVEPGASMLEFMAWRCLMCGDIVDGEIALNRANPKRHRLSKYKARLRYGKI